MMKRLVVLYQQHDHKKKKDNIEVGMEIIIESNENLVGNVTLNPFTSQLPYI
jgi:hypothetical protein